MFNLEEDLLHTTISTTFIQNLIHLDNRKSYYEIEPRGLFGIPDLVIGSASISDDTLEIEETYAFELKLSKWRRALIQAYRYRAFANISFVVLDESHIAPALKNLDEFKKANVGLMSVSKNGNTQIHHHPVFDEPYSTQLHTEFIQIIMEGLKNRHPEFEILI